MRSFPICFEFNKHVVNMYKTLFDIVPLRFNFFSKKYTKKYYYSILGFCFVECLFLMAQWNGNDVFISGLIIWRILKESSNPYPWAIRVLHQMLHSTSFLHLKCNILLVTQGFLRGVQYVHLLLWRNKRFGWKCPSMQHTNGFLCEVLQLGASCSVTNR